MTRPLVVVGDALLDIDLDTHADRLSPDAPVPVLHEPQPRPRPGGAALAALLAAREHPHVVLVAPLRDDAAGEQLCGLLRDRVDVVAVPTSAGTAVKRRLRVGQHVVARIDTGGEPVVPGPLPSAARRAVEAAGTLLVADYGRGMTAEPALRRLLAQQSRHVPVVWDPHPRGSEPVPGARLATPNTAEARAAVPDIDGDGLPAVRRRAAELVRRWSASAVAVTLGDGGCLLSFGDGAPLVMPARPVHAIDTCGAGDRFAAAAAAALADGALPSEAACRAVEAATAFVAAGAAASALDGQDVSQPERDEDLDALLRRVRAAHGRVVATGGCFDLLHPGHVATLEAARRLGDCLVVCLNSDASVRRLKGPGRPLQPAADRRRVLEALHCVDAVEIFDEDTPERVLQRVRPDVWVKGGDYAGVTLPEAGVLAGWGGEVVTLPFRDGRSTSELVALARATPDAR